MIIKSSHFDSDSCHFDSRYSHSESVVPRFLCPGSHLGLQNRLRWYLGDENDGNWTPEVRSVVVQWSCSLSGHDFSPKLFVHRLQDDYPCFAIHHLADLLMFYGRMYFSYS